jgi:hypothetical protein
MRLAVLATLQQERDFVRPRYDAGNRRRCDDRGCRVGPTARIARRDRYECDAAAPDDLGKVHRACNLLVGSLGDCQMRIYTQCQSFRLNLPFLTRLLRL